MVNKWGQSKLLWNIDPEALTTNPLRLAFSGVAQIFYELFHSGSVIGALKVLLGSTAYTPAVSKDYVLKAEVDNG